MRLVLDTNCVVSAFLWGGTPRQILAAKAEIIVSGDRHLLDLKEYQGIRIVTAAETVALLAGK